MYGIYSSLTTKLTYHLFSESPNKCLLIYVQRHFGQIITHYSTGVLSPVSPRRMCAPDVHGHRIFLVVIVTLSSASLQASVPSCPLVSHIAGVLCMIIDGTRACRHPGSDGWWGLCVTELFPSKIFPRLHSLTSHCGYKLELVQLCVSFLMCDTLVSTSH